MENQSWKSVIEYKNSNLWSDRQIGVKGLEGFQSFIARRLSETFHSEQHALSLPKEN
jgi:hypothetical protein